MVSVALRQHQSNGLMLLEKSLTGAQHFSENSVANLLDRK